MNYNPQYHWELLDWEDCSAKCGGGVQTAKYDCVEDKAGKVSATFCAGEEKPQTLTKKCSEQPCQTKYVLFCKKKSFIDALQSPKCNLAQATYSQKSN